MSPGASHFGKLIAVTDLSTLSLCLAQKFDHEDFEGV